ncbi:MAG: alpha/beta fold hydrolase [Balneolaceae bacterium]|nr:alpha/beta fold hydrolase [Balneolaceae bacterium]
MKSEKLQFQGAFGDTLSARIDLPDEKDPIAYTLFAHCFTCSKNLKAVGNIARALTDEGIGVFRFDFTGLGESEGDFADTNFSSNVDDLVAASEYMDQKYKAPDILLGHSLGGAAVLQAAHQIPSSRAVATIGAPCNPEHVKQNFGAKLDEIEETGEAEVTLAGRSFTIRKQFLDDLEENRMDNFINQLKRALIIFHSPIDNTVGIENAAHIFKLAKHPKSFISLDDADHLISDSEDSEYVGKMLATWSLKFL